MVILTEYRIEYRHDDLLEQSSQSDPEYERHCPDQQILLHIKTGQFFLLQTDQEIGCELPAPFFQHEPRHIIDQPCHDEHDKKSRHPKHRSQHHGF